MRYRSFFIIALTGLLFSASLLLAQTKQEPLRQDFSISITHTFSAGTFPLVHEGKAAPLYVDTADARVVKIAAEAFGKDVALVTGQLPALNSRESGMAEFAVIAGTAGQSELLARLPEGAKQEIAAIAGQWETFSIFVVDVPFEGVKKALVVAGSDPRGTAFGLFEISRLIGVSPWYWWADVAPEPRENLYIKQGQGSSTMGPPAVKYRGIFLNDEDWGLQPWAAANIDTDVKDIGPNTYARIFELLLRLKANLIWPAMHPSTKAFFHYPGNPEMAKAYSIVIGTSHAEPMLRNNVDEWEKETMGHFDYIRNKETVYNYWDTRAAESKNNDAIYTLGMRGIHDSGMEGVKGTAEAAEILEKTITDQRNILKEHVNKDVTTIPQAFTAYKEVLDIYDHGLELPEDITIVWPDDNYGYIRRLSNEQEQHRSGGSGVYYHASYWGRPHDYLWLSSTHPSLIWEEMWKAYRMNAREMWVLNVGDIKPLEYDISLFMDMAYNMENFSESKSVKKHLLAWTAEVFGEEKAGEISNILWEYYQLAFERRPEFMGWSRTEPTTGTSYSAYNHFYYGDEAQKRLDRYTALEGQVKALRPLINEKDKDAFYQLVYYPVAGASFMNKKFLYRDKSYYYALQNRASAAGYAQMARQAYDSIVKETEFYNTQLAGGKWNGMMSMKPRNLPVYQEPVLPEMEMEQSDDLGILPEGFARADSSVLAGAGKNFRLPVFYPWADKKYFIDLYLQGEEAISWKASPSHKWIKLSEQKGTLTGGMDGNGKRIWVSVDWSKAPEGKNARGYVKVKGGGKKTKVAVQAFDTPGPELKAWNGFIEENGYLSVYAENYSRKNDAEGASWAEIEGLGYTGASLMALPLQGSPFEGNESIVAEAPSVEYDFYTFSDTSLVFYIHTLPTHPVTDGSSMRFGISVDGGPVETADFRTRGRSEEWKVNVLRNNAVSKIPYGKLSTGKHTLKIYMIDPGVILDRILIDAGGLVDAYSAIPETGKQGDRTGKGDL